MCDLLAIDPRQIDHLEPAQQPQLGARIAQAIEDHQPHQRLDIETDPVALQGALERPGHPQLLPQPQQQPQVPHGQGRRESDVIPLGGGVFLTDRCASRRLEQTVDQGIDVRIRSRAKSSCDSVEFGRQPRELGFGYVK